MLIIILLLIDNNNDDDDDDDDDDGEKIVTFVIIKIATFMRAIHITTLVVIYIILEIWIASNIIQPKGNIVGLINLIKHRR